MVLVIATYLLLILESLFSYNEYWWHNGYYFFHVLLTFNFRIILNLQKSYKDRRVHSLIWSRTSYCIQQSCLHKLNDTWQFLSLVFSLPWPSWRVLVRYFIECPSFLVCLMFSHNKDWGYSFLGRLSQRLNTLCISSYLRYRALTRYHHWWCKL